MEQVRYELYIYIYIYIYIQPASNLIQKLRQIYNTQKREVYRKEEYYLQNKKTKLNQQKYQLECNNKRQQHKSEWRECRT